MGVENTCVRCHMGEGLDHHFEPEVATCRECHPTASNFDVNGVQTAVQAKLDDLGNRLLAWGLINENSPDGHPTVSSAPEKHAMALWNWIYVSHEDKSKGVHNSGYTMALLDSGLVWLPPAPPKTARLP